MFPEPIDLSLSLSRLAGLVPRLMMQVAASALLTAFYTPGGAAGWILDLVLRAYFAMARRAPLRFSLPIRLPVLVRAYGGASKLITLCRSATVFNAPKKT